MTEQPDATGPGVLPGQDGPDLIDMGYLSLPENVQKAAEAGLPGAIGARIREARKAAGMTQEALAEAVGVTQTAVSYWEAGKRDPGTSELVRVAEALGVPAASLLPAGEPSGPQDAPQGRLARVEVKGFRDLGIVRVSESTLAGEPMLRAESTDGAVAEFPASSLHFITWLPEGAQEKPAITSGDPWAYDVRGEDEGPF